MASAPAAGNEIVVSDQGGEIVRSAGNEIVCSAGNEIVRSASNEVVCDRPAELKRLIKRNRHHLAH
jgi:hypothetical protein